MSQKELEETQKLVKAQGEQIATLTKSLETVVTKLVGAPMRKSVAAVSQVAKPGSEPEPKSLNKAEIKEALREKIRAGGLKKKDKDAIYAFYDSGSTDLTKIAHLLKD